jgi:hypothetical protein
MERRPPIPIATGRSRSDVRPGHEAGRAHRPDRPRDAPQGPAAVRSGPAGARRGGLARRRVDVCVQRTLCLAP